MSDDKRPVFNIPDPDKDAGETQDPDAPPAEDASDDTVAPGATTPPPGRSRLRVARREPREEYLFQSEALHNPNAPATERTAEPEGPEKEGSEREEDTGEPATDDGIPTDQGDRKSTRLNSSHYS